MRQRVAQNLGLIAFTIFCALTLVLVKYSGAGLDRWISELIQQVVPQSMDPFFSVFSVLGAFELQTAVLFAVLLSYRPGRKKSLIYVGAYTLGTLIELILKLWLPHSGPTRELFRYDLPLFFASSYVYTGHSYPSGHSFRTTYLVLLLLLELYARRGQQTSKRWVQITVILSLGIMLFTRVSLGEHWFTDVLGGAILGIAGSLLAWSQVTKKHLSN